MIYILKIQKHVLANFKISKRLQQGFRINDQYTKMWCIPVNQEQLDKYLENKFQKNFEK